MSGMKRFLHDVADELGVDPMDKRALDEANRRLGQPVQPAFDPLDEWVLTPDEARAIEEAFKRPPSTIRVSKLPIRLCPTRERKPL